MQIDLSYNRLTGKVPKEIALNKNIEQFKIEVNQVEGGIPEELANLSHLVSPLPPLPRSLRGGGGGGGRWRPPGSSRTCVVFACACPPSRSRSDHA